MNASLTLVVLMAVMYACGVYVMLERSLTRVLIGFLLVGNATNLLIFIMSGRPGNAPIVTGTSLDDSMVDPVPQVLMLTAIVINFGITALLLALIYRSWWLARLGDEGDNLGDEHVDDVATSSESALRSSSEDEDAVQDSLDEFERGTDDSDAPVPTIDPPATEGKTR
ncbi:sodium:proton antiporter [Cryobacterium psychrophilum]|uniref:Na(+)/H(+) antiporter subunit C n=1 Tax=Cryobacterium psychrophilum TaxID=41988 RepID=A0A4Y8KSB4_9MICO|nr:NADH-quinone oxidoreductase subunit K [Cryobacterium psychrophilum]TDW29575.1 multisubunit sodium/proton antiporter MrpC subunit [Cryobacterium psychrophilum]TFD81707.1 Na(+)/H(+) antiporter subunit C [Cryobacterium psychrophilum]